MHSVFYFIISLKAISLNLRHFFVKKENQKFIRKKCSVFVRVCCVCANAPPVFFFKPLTPFFISLCDPPLPTLASRVLAFFILFFWAGKSPTVCSIRRSWGLLKQLLVLGAWHVQELSTTNFKQSGKGWETGTALSKINKQHCKLENRVHFSMVWQKVPFAYVKYNKLSGPQMESTLSQQPVLISGID